MYIRTMNATFGKLEQAELRLQPGLNVICAPNESGKSTWCRFIRSMLYGVSTGERGPMADKNRYAPWSGAPMRGRMDLTVDGANFTLTRETLRAGTPMGEFSCVYTGTADPVSGLTDRNVGEQLLGISREVFERSAFIGQAALAVDQNTELERRIAALITTGEEKTSYSETSERLKKQLNRRKHNKTGQIPALERELDQLDEDLNHLAELQEQYAQTTRSLKEIRANLALLQEQERLWAAADRQEQLRQYREAEEAASAAGRRAEAMAQSAGALPDDALLARLEARVFSLTADQQEAERVRRSAKDADDSYRQAEEFLRAQPLYPADEQGIRDRLDQLVPPEVPSPRPRTACLVLGLIALITAAGFLIAGLTPFALFATAVGAAGLVFVGILKKKERLVAAQRDTVLERQQKLEQQAEEYLPLRRATLDAADEAHRIAGLADALCRRFSEGVEELIKDLSPYCTVTDLPAASVAIAQLRSQSEALTHAREMARESSLQLEYLRKSLPAGEEPRELLPQPTMSRSQLRLLQPQTLSALRSAQSRLDTLTGQIRSMGDPDDLIVRRDRKREELAQLRDEYDAIALAMEALDGANLTLQSRFSPALGARAAEIFSALTAGRYDAVVLSRDFSLAAEPSGDPTARSIRLLSQGAADQLYLSVRLAICDMVLPRDKAVPLILDDALVSFDDDRLHAALDYLLRESEKRQILLFTCQGREADYLTGRENATVLAL